jgi:hypothetical protein
MTLFKSLQKMSNPNCLTKQEVFEFQKKTISRIADYVYDLEDALAETGTDLATTKKEVAWLKKAIEVELEGVVAIVEEFHGI